jgi:hypothetical protein
MKYSLRSLMVAVLVLPPLLALVIWRFIPAPPEKRGTAEDMKAFLRAVKKPNSSEIYEATERCFVVGALASRYEALFAKADQKGVPDSYIPFSPTATQYVFWCAGMAPGSGDEEGDAYVVVVIDGKPPAIVHSAVEVLKK